MKVKVKEPEAEKEELEEEAEEEEAEAEESEPAAEATDNVGDPSVEINVEELIHELEVDGVVQPGKEQAAKRRLELLMEEKRAKRDLEDFDDYNV
jgi:phage antirepressor YoqD-like protein